MTRSLGTPSDGGGGGLGVTNTLQLTFIIVLTLPSSGGGGNRGVGTVIGEVIGGIVAVAAIVFVIFKKAGISFTLFGC